MLQRLIHSARVNVFESARFYYWVMVILTIHLVFRHSYLKFLMAYGIFEWLAFYIYFITAFLYGALYWLCVISAFYLRKKISRLFFNTWLIIVCISVLNEFFFYKENEFIYDIYSSFTTGQLFTNFRITLPLIFLSVFHALNHNKTLLLQPLLNLIFKLTLLNSVIVLSGVVFDISFFESYPGSSRWGYSGFLARGYSVVLSSIFLIELLKKEVFYSVKPFLLLFALLCSGTKAGILSVFLIFFVIVIKSVKIRLIITSVIFTLFLTLTKWMPSLLILSEFWRTVFNNHGPWGVLFSLRNENLFKFFEVVKNNYTISNWIVGGEIRFETLWVEMLLFDIFVFYGLLGSVILVFLFFKVTPSLKESIPILVSFFSGGLITGTFLLICYFLWLDSVNETKNLINNNPLCSHIK